MDHNYFVYMMSNRPQGVIYIGVTNDLLSRVWQHKHHLVPGFTARYNLENLVWYEQTSNINSAIAREKQLKNWRRAWKIALIEENNSSWLDLYDRIVG